MVANVESMFYVREKPWHGLGAMVAEAPDSTAALRLAGLDWNVVQKDIMIVDGSVTIPGFKANVRDTDGSVLGIVTDRYTMADETGEGGDRATPLPLLFIIVPVLKCKVCSQESGPGLLFYYTDKNRKFQEVWK